jgi:hypothetical protein
VSSLHSSLIANNTGLEDGLVATPGCSAAIGGGGASHEGSPSTNVRFANNLADHYTIGGLSDVNVTYDHNVALDVYSTQSFVHVAGGKWVFGEPAGTDANGNVTVVPSKTYASQFQAWNPAALSFNVMLKSGSVAIGSGTATGAPTVDILGVARAVPYEVGAYSYPR